MLLAHLTSNEFPLLIALLSLAIGVGIGLGIAAMRGRLGRREGR